MSRLVIFLALCAASSAEYYEDTWYPIEEVTSNGLDMHTLLKPLEPIATTFYENGDEFVLTAVLPVDSENSIVVNSNEAMRTVTVTAKSETLQASYSRKVYGVTRNIPPGYSTKGRWMFTPSNHKFTVVFPKNGEQSSNFPKVHSSMQHESGVGDIDGIRVTYSKSQFQSRKETHEERVQGIRKPPTHERPDDVPIRTVKAASSINSVTVSVLWMSAVVTLMKYVCN